MIKNVLLDVGGVLVDLDRKEAVRRFEALGVTDADEVLDTYRQSGLLLELESGQIDTEEFARRLSARYGCPIGVEMVTEALEGFIGRVAEEKLTFLDERIRPYYRLLALSNTNPPLHRFFESPRFVTSGRPLSSYFERLFISFEMGLCKPDRAIFQQLIRESGIRPEETLFLDDGPANTAMARRLGMVAYTCANGEDWRPLLERLLL